MAATRSRLTARLASGWIPLVLAVCSFAVVFAQRPGKTFADSRVELSSDPSLFLHRVSQIWSSTTDLGHVQSGQFVGYLFPMGPWFALAHQLGVSMWVAERLWLGCLLALSAWGVVLLMDCLYDRRRGVAHLGAGVLFAANPYVVTFGSRATVALLAYVAMPWLMMATHRGIRKPRGWLWPIFIALTLAAGGGGVNAAFLPWVIGPAALLVIYEIALLRLPGRNAWPFIWRTALCSFVASAWWLVPVALQSRYGGNFLSFLEQPAAIWSTTSMSESLRLLGYWIFYFGTGYHGSPEASVSVAGAYLFSPAVILATFAVPVLAVFGLTWNRGWRYAPFFAFLMIAGLIAMTIGFPEGKPLERVLSSAYYNLGSLQFLRTSYKAAPDVALGLSCLAGAAVATLYSSAKAGRFRVLGLRVPRWALLPLVLVPVGYALPFFNGTAIDPRLDYKVPTYWRSALADSNRTTPADKRIMVLPGQLFSWYRWGETIVSIAPSLSQRPVLVRQASLYADPRSSQLQTTVDDLVQQGRLVPGQLPPLLGLMAVGQVLVPTDGLGAQSGEPDPATAARALRSDLPPQAAAASYGKVRTYVPDQGRGGSAVRLPDIRRYDVSSSGPGIVRVQPTGGATVLDGDAQGIASLAAVGGLDLTRPLFYAGDLGAPAVRDRVRDGATLTFTDSNRRTFVSGSRVTEDQSETLGPTDPIADGLPFYDLFPSRGTAGQTVALYSGLRYLRTPLFQGVGLTPQYRPYAALDGRLSTTWIPTSSDPRLRYIELALAHPRPVNSIRVHPHADIAGGTSRLAISVNGGPERKFTLNYGWSTLPIHSPDLRTLRIRVAGVVLGGGLGGIDEVQIPGLHVHEVLRTPTQLAQDTRGMDLSHNPISVVLERTTADFPYRAGAEVEAAEAGNPFDDVDAEPGIERLVTLPAARSFSLDGWASVNPAAPDSQFDRLAGMPDGWRFLSSSRFEGWPIHRASSAFDGNPKTAWVGNYLKQQFSWISITAPRPFEVQRFRLRPLSSAFSFPDLLQVRAPGGFRVQVPVAPDGSVTLPEALRTRSLRLNILGLRGSTDRRDLRAVAISEIEIPGLTPPRPRRSGQFSSRCGELTVTAAGSRATAVVSGTIGELDAGLPLALKSCGPTGSLYLPQGASQLSAPPGAFSRPDHLRLLSVAPAGASPGQSESSAPTVVSPGKGDNGRRDDVRVSTSGPAWLVLGESYSRGWEASCGPAGGKKHSLGAPVPIDGYANGWRIGSACQVADFYFRPQRLVNASYLLSLVGIGLMLILLVGGLVFSRLGIRGLGWVWPQSESIALAGGAGSALWFAPPFDRVRRLSLLPALATGALAGALGGLLFALRAGLVIGPVTFVLLLLGVSVRRLLALALLGLLIVTGAYLASPSPDAGGFYFFYPLHYIDEHWIAVGVVCALSAASVLMARDLDTSRAAPKVDDEGPRRHFLSALGDWAIRRRRPARTSGR